ncbi:MAG: DNA polymerase III subunit alpha [Solirubrobacterales bacterium]
MGRSTAYTELHCHSWFSFLDGASSPIELAETAAQLGYEALALTDHDGVWGSMEFALACRASGIRAITGAEVTVEWGDRTNHLTLLVEDGNGYANLCRLLTEAHVGTRAGPERRQGQPAISLELLEGRTEGLVCLTGCAGNGLVASAWGDGRAGEAGVRRLRELFGPDNLAIEIQRPYWRNDLARNAWLEGLGHRLQVPVVATGNVHSHTPARAALQDVLVSVRLGMGIEAAESFRRGNHTSCLVPPEEMAARFGDRPEALRAGIELADRLRFELDRELGYRYPRAGDPAADTDLRELCRSRFDDRYRQSSVRIEARRRMEDELDLIGRLGLSGFFLLHHELLELASQIAVEVRGRDSSRSTLPPGRGRGSSVSSVLCYLTGLSHVDPVQAGLFPGRFLNEETTAVPDIDLDFPRDIRERLIPRIHQRYGHDRSALVASFPTYRLKGSVRDFGKALGLPRGEIEKVARASDGREGVEGLRADLPSLLGPERARARRWRILTRLAEEARGLPRHASQHPGGMVISTTPLTSVCPVVPAAMEGRQTVQWDKDSCQDAGFLKIDLLGLGMLSVVERCVDEIARSRGVRVDLSRIDLEDRRTFEAIREADTTGVFQIESRAQMQLLPRLRPENLEDLAVQVALIRPGPIQGGAVHPYVMRRKRLREDPDWEVPYPHPLARRSLEETLGVIVFQEQVLEVSMDVAGFSATEAEGLRRAMSRKRSGDSLRAYRHRFLEGAARRGVQREAAERIFSSVEAFSGFGFPKSHSVAFALLAYQSAWLKVHFGPEYLCSLLNEQPMGFYPPDSLVQYGLRTGIKILPPDVNASQVKCTAEPAVPVEDDDRGPAELAVRMGLGYIRDLGKEEAAGLVVVRDRDGSFSSVADLASRCSLARPGMEALAWSGAFRNLPDGDRVSSLWTAGSAARRTRGTRGEGAHQPPLPFPMPAPPKLEQPDGDGLIRADYESTGVCLEGHPMVSLREALPKPPPTLAKLRGLPDRSTTEAVGLARILQRPMTARGTCFILLEDQTEVLNLIIPPALARQERLVLRTARFLAVTGKIERKGLVVNLVCTEVSSLDRKYLAL